MLVKGADAVDVGGTVVEVEVMFEDVTEIVLVVEFGVVEEEVLLEVSVNVVVEDEVGVVVVVEDEVGAVVVVEVGVVVVVEVGVVVVVEDEVGVVVVVEDEVGVVVVVEDEVGVVVLVDEVGVVVVVEVTTEADVGNGVTVGATVAPHGAE